MLSKGDFYTCAICGNTFKTEWSGEEALAELKENFEDTSAHDCHIVCDDCYKLAMELKESKNVISEIES